MLFIRSALQQNAVTLKDRALAVAWAVPVRKFTLFIYSFILFFSVLSVVADLLARLALNHFHFAHEAVMYSLLSVPEAGVRFVYAVECLLLAVLCFAQAKKQIPARADRRRDLAARTRLLVGCLLLAIACSVAFTLGRPIAAVGLLTPGSFLTRIIIDDSAPWLHRWFEPVYWALFISFVLLARTNVRGARLGAAARAICALLLLLLFESHAMRPSQFYSREFLGYSLLPIVQFLLVQVVLWGLAECLDEEWENDEMSRAWLTLTAPRVAVLGVVSLLSVIFAWYAEIAFASRQTIAVGAHYYSWFPENWRGGYVAEKVVPPYGPELREYSSDNSRVLSRHIGAAQDAGIGFFIFDWWPNRPGIGFRLRRNIPKVSWGNFKFALLYESLDLKPNAASPVAYEDQNAVVLTRERTAAMQTHWEHIAKRYANSNSYLTVGNKPIIYLYATRHLLGQVSRRVTQARLWVKAQTGRELYLVADEVFFNVLTNGETKALMNHEGVPYWERLVAFDGLTSYNPYDSTRLEHAGEAGARRFVADVVGIYRRYRAIAAVLGYPFVPGVLPGYNDRGVRLGANHFVIPRTLDDGTSFFDLMIREAGLPLIDRSLPMLSVTSWNEWNEGTSIEPMISTEPSIDDFSEGGNFYTQGEVHHGRGCRELDTLSTLLRDSRPSAPP